MSGRSSRQHEIYTDTTRRAETYLPTLATDLFHWTLEWHRLSANCRLLQVSDHTNTIINHLKGIFHEHGIPERLISDNGPQYSSEEFRVFSARYEFDHVTSSQLYPQSNGFIERTVQTVKKIFPKAKEGGGKLHSAMLCLRTTPTDHNLPSPCELLNESTCLIIPVEWGCKMHFCNSDRMDKSRTMTALRGNLHPYPHNKQCEC